MLWVWQNFPTKLFNCLFSHVSDIWAIIVMLDNHTVLSGRSFQLNCFLEAVHLFNIQFSIERLVVLKYVISIHSANVLCSFGSILTSIKSIRDDDDKHARPCLLGIPSQQQHQTTASQDSQSYLKAKYATKDYASRSFAKHQKK